ncbi:MAG: TonB-dependent receptor domain-containing protein [Fidelibacterota bacterium]
MKLRFFVILLVVSFLVAQTGRIYGVVQDGESGEPLIGANILIKGSLQGTATDENGEFDLSRLSLGRHTIFVTMIGYQALDQDVELTEQSPEVYLSLGLDRDVIALSRVIVTAGRSEQDLMEAPLSVSILEPRVIEEKLATSLEEVLIFQPGVAIVKNQLNIRGASGFTLGAGSRSLLLLDGIPLMGSAAGNITWSIVPTSEIKQVEIVKSGGSALYGSGAMGGVVNILTRTAPLKPETRIALKKGIYSTPRFRQWQWREQPGFYNVLDISHARPLGSHGMWIRFQSIRDDGYTELGWKRSVNLTGKLKLNFGNRFSGSVYANFLADNGGLESQWKSPADPFEAPDNSIHDESQGTKLNTNAGLSIILNSRSILRLKTALYDVHWKNTGTNNDTSDEQKFYGDIQYDVRLWGRLRLVSGMTVQRAQIDADIFGKHTTFTHAEYALLKGKIGAGLLSLGGRFESFLVDGTLLDQQFIPQIAANYRLAPWFSLRTSVGKGFRSPTVAELFSRSRLNVFTIAPNPNLEAEISLGSEIGFTARVAGRSSFLNYLQADGAWFTTSFEQLIEPTPDSFGVIHFQNVTKARISGFDFGLQGQFLARHVMVQGAYTYLNPDVLSPAGDVIDTLAYRYRQHFTQTVTVRLGPWSFSIDSRHTSALEKTKLFSENPLTGSDRRVPVHVWNSGLAWQDRHWEIHFRVENIFQYYYTDLERNMGPERMVLMSVFWKI